MSIKKNVAIVDGKALNAPPTPEKQSSPPAEVKLDDKIVRAFLSDTNIYDLWKKLADDGGMKIYGVKDAAHLEEIINKQGREIILSANVASAKAELEATTSVIRDVVDRYFDDTTRKDVFGRIAFRYDHKNSVWSFRARVNHNDLPKKKRNGNGNGKRKNGNDLPNANPASKKKRKGNGDSKKKKQEIIIFKGVPMKQKKKREVIIRNGKKKKDALDYAVPGHFEANK